MRGGACVEIDCPSGRLHLPPHRRSVCIEQIDPAEGLRPPRNGDRAIRIVENRTEWVELSLDGQLTGRYPYAYEQRVALTSDGYVFVQHANLNPSGHGISYELLTLGRTSSTWRPTQTAPKGELVAPMATL